MASGPGVGSGAGAGVGVGPSPLASGVHAPLFRRRGSGAAPSSGLLSCPSSSSQLLSLAPKEQGARKRTGGLLPGIARIVQGRKRVCRASADTSDPGPSRAASDSPPPSSPLSSSLAIPRSLRPLLDAASLSALPVEARLVVGTKAVIGGVAAAAMAVSGFQFGATVLHTLEAVPPLANLETLVGSAVSARFLASYIGDRTARSSFDSQVAQALDNLKSAFSYAPPLGKGVGEGEPTQLPAQGESGGVEGVRQITEKGEEQQPDETQQLVATTTKALKKGGEEGEQEGSLQATQLLAVTTTKATKFGKEEGEEEGALQMTQQRRRKGERDRGGRQKRRSKGQEAEQPAHGVRPSPADGSVPVLVSAQAKRYTPGVPSASGAPEEVEEPTMLEVELRSLVDQSAAVAAAAYPALVLGDEKPQDPSNSPSHSRSHSHSHSYSSSDSGSQSQSGAESQSCSSPGHSHSQSEELEDPPSPPAVVVDRRFLVNSMAHFIRTREQQLYTGQGAPGESQLLARESLNREAFKTDRLRSLEPDGTPTAARGGVQARVGGGLLPRIEEGEEGVREDEGEGVGLGMAILREGEGEREGEGVGRVEGQGEGELEGSGCGPLVLFEEFLGQVGGSRAEEKREAREPELVLAASASPRPSSPASSYHSFYPPSPSYPSPLSPHSPRSASSSPRSGTSSPSFFDASSSPWGDVSMGGSDIGFGEGDVSMGQGGGVAAGIIRNLMGPNTGSSRGTSLGNGAPFHSAGNSTSNSPGDSTGERRGNGTGDSTGSSTRGGTGKSTGDSSGVGGSSLRDVLSLESQLENLGLSDDGSQPSSEDGLKEGHIPSPFSFSVSPQGSGQTGGQHHAGVSRGEAGGVEGFEGSAVEMEEEELGDLKPASDEEYEAEIAAAFERAKAFRARLARLRQSREERMERDRRAVLLGSAQDSHDATQATQGSSVPELDPSSAPTVAAHDTQGWAVAESDPAQVPSRPAQDTPGRQESDWSPSQEPWAAAQDPGGWPETEADALPEIAQEALPGADKEEHFARGAQGMPAPGLDSPAWTVGPAWMGGETMASGSHGIPSPPAGQQLISAGGWVAAGTPELGSTGLSPTTPEIAGPVLAQGTPESGVGSEGHAQGIGKAGEEWASGASQGWSSDVDDTEWVSGGDVRPGRPAPPAWQGTSQPGVGVEAGAGAGQGTVQWWDDSQWQGDRAHDTAQGTVESVQWWEGSPWQTGAGSQAGQKAAVDSRSGAFLDADQARDPADAGDASVDVVDEPALAEDEAEVGDKQGKTDGERGAQREGASPEEGTGAALGGIGAVQAGLQAVQKGTPAAREGSDSVSKGTEAEALEAQEAQAHASEEKQEAVSDEQWLARIRMARGERRRRRGTQKEGNPQA